MCAVRCERVRGHALKRACVCHARLVGWALHADSVTQRINLILQGRAYGVAAFAGGMLYAAGGMSGEEYNESFERLVQVAATVQCNRLGCCWCGMSRTKGVPTPAELWGGVALGTVCRCRLRVYARQTAGGEEALARAMERQACCPGCCFDGALYVGASYCGSRWCCRLLPVARPSTIPPCAPPLASIQLRPPFQRMGHGAAAACLRHQAGLPLRRRGVGGVSSGVCGVSMPRNSRGAAAANTAAVEAGQEPRRRGALRDLERCQRVGEAARQALLLWFCCCTLDPCI